MPARTDQARDARSNGPSADSCASPPAQRASASTTGGRRGTGAAGGGLRGRHLVGVAVHPFQGACAGLRRSSSGQAGGAMAWLAARRARWRPPQWRLQTRRASASAGSQPPAGAAVSSQPTFTTAEGFHRRRTRCRPSVASTSRARHGLCHGRGASRSPPSRGRRLAVAASSLRAAASPPSRFRRVAGVAANVTASASAAVPSTRRPPASAAGGPADVFVGRRGHAPATFSRGVTSATALGAHTLTALAAFGPTFVAVPGRVASASAGAGGCTFGVARATARRPNRLRARHHRVRRSLRPPLATGPSHRAPPGAPAVPAAARRHDRRRSTAELTHPRGAGWCRRQHGQHALMMGSQLVALGTGPARRVMPTSSSWLLDHRVAGLWFSSRGSSWRRRSSL